MTEHGLGRRVPQDDDHIRRYPLRAVAPVTVAHVEDVLPLPPLRAFYDQGREGACVGFGWSWAMSILNRINRSFPKYAAPWLYQQAQLVDGWDDTPPEEGTSVRAAGDILRTLGHERVWMNHAQRPTIANGIIENRWAQSVDEVRACIAAGIPVVIGVNWYSAFDAPEKVGRDFWIGRNDLSSIRGGHCVCVYGASDKRQAVKIVNNWGVSYPLVWMPYTTLQRLINEDGEVAVISDRIDP
jgi:hypothetical protein